MLVLLALKTLAALVWQYRWVHRQVERPLLLFWIRWAWLLLKGSSRKTGRIPWRLHGETPTPSWMLVSCYLPASSIRRRDPVIVITQLKLASVSFKDSTLCPMSAIMFLTLKRITEHNTPIIVKKLIISEVTHTQRERRTDGIKSRVMMTTTIALLLQTIPRLISC